MVKPPLCRCARRGQEGARRRKRNRAGFVGTAPRPMRRPARARDRRTRRAACAQNGSAKITSDRPMIHRPVCAVS
ncbi:hypothetical protein [Sphingopyxis terrae]|uniref:hypothetical protein n=1 Tax=Sphingopyxis terrae TaxID=33052 RepID=UPI000EAA44D1